MQYPYKDLQSLTLPGLFDYAVGLYANRELFGRVGEEAFSYAEFSTKVKELIALLQSYGIEKGDKVVLLSENTPNWGVAYFAITFPIFSTSVIDCTVTTGTIISNSLLFTIVSIA